MVRGVDNKCTRIISGVDDGKVGVVEEKGRTDKLRDGVGVIIENSGVRVIAGLERV